MVNLNLSKTFKYVNANGDSIILDYDHGFLINKPQGIDTVSVSLTEARGINQVGTTVQSSNVDSRPVTVSGILVGEFQQTNKNRLMSVVRPDISGKLYADDFYLDVKVTATPIVEPYKSFSAFQFSLLAPYPYWQHDESASMVLAGIQKKFKFPWNISKPYTFGSLQETQFINVRNDGQLPVPFKVTFLAKSEVVNPEILDVESGAFLRLKTTMTAGERIVIDITHERTYVTSSKDGNIRGALSLASKLNRLGIGDNVLKPIAEEGLEQLEVSIDFATEIVGITV